MKYFIFFLIFLFGCGKELADVPTVNGDKPNPGGSEKVEGDVRAAICILVTIDADKRFTIERFGEVNNDLPLVKFTSHTGLDESRNLINGRGISVITHYRDSKAAKEGQAEGCYVLGPEDRNLHITTRVAIGENPNEDVNFDVIEEHETINARFYIKTNGLIKVVE